MFSPKQKRLIYYLFCLLILLVAVVKLSRNLLSQVEIDSFKRLYSAYSTALNLTVYEMDGDVDCYFGASKNIKNKYKECDLFYKKFVSNLNVAKYCKDNGKKNGCVPSYKNYAISPNCAGYSENMMNKFNQSFIMRDRTNLVIFTMPSNSPKPMFAVDINGKLPPNKTGYDLFSFVIMKNERGEYYFHPNIVYCLPAEKGGIQGLGDILK